MFSRFTADSEDSILQEFYQMQTLIKLSCWGDPAYRLLWLAEMGHLSAGIIALLLNDSS
ncbi:hypothetical protein POUND7_014518 [Theobroma cacao]